MRLPRPGARTAFQLTQSMPHLFYALMVLALLGVLFGSPGLGLLLLVLGGGAHVARVGIEALCGTAVEPRVRVPEAINGEIEVRRARPRVRGPLPEPAPEPPQEPEPAQAPSVEHPSRRAHPQVPQRVARPRVSRSPERPADLALVSAGAVRRRPNRPR